MSQRVPITLIIDDSCPLIHVYRHHVVEIHKEPPLTHDGRELIETIPNAFLDRFCDVAERHGLAGKLSIVPAPADLGDVVQGIAGFDPVLTRQWLATIQTRMGPRFDFSPEMLTHVFAVDLASGEHSAESESVWSQSQGRAVLTPYLTRSLTLLKEAGIDATGFTSPWSFGQQVEAEYLASMAVAQRTVYDRDLCWYYLHHDPFSGGKPYAAYARDAAVVVSIESTVRDFLWDTIHSDRTDRAFIEMIADRMVTADGSSGAIRTALDGGGWPILVTHWQCLYSNGLETGLAVIDLVAERVAATLSDRVEWQSCLEMARRTVAELRLNAVPTTTS